ncbi:cytidylyltransferase domain-containing protein [Marinospirillum perlucidum]|uniref:acylneuraminate cytidylyltransferase family protein n=1 Tax=Marinospirillum perlucidum TaxID=1982602 RepID=UPI000DF17B97|nr:acylneuraminate cytidylyltransferase family protein [Marinospirillum perlucidum]
MIEYTHKVLAVIPARAGSKRLPGKNTKLLAGKPLVQWTLDLALESPEIDLVAVTSDDPQILNLASNQKDCYCLERPAELSSDTATTFAVLKHTLEELNHKGIHPELTLLLQPTSPLRNQQDIQKGFNLFRDKKANSVISVCPVEHSPLWCNTLDDSVSMDRFLSPDILNKRSQDLPQHYRLNGAFYLAKSNLLLKNQGFFMVKSHALVMPTERSIDIDTLYDYEIAEFLMKRYFKLSTQADSSK